MLETCPVYHVAKFLGKRWTLLVISELNRGRKKWKRYSEIKRKLPNMTPKMLSARFKELEAEGILRKRVDASTFPIKSEYSLTRKGQDFSAVIASIKEWGLKHEVKNDTCHDMNCKECDF